MNTKHISLAFAAVVTLLAGCAKSPIEETTNAGGLTDLELAYVGSTEVKSAIDGTAFPQTGEIGLFLFTDEAATTPYGETGYINVKYAYNSTKGKWTASPSIKVGSTPGYLYGYYPYSSEAESIKAIPVASSLDGDDVMYASTQDVITDMTASQTSITMNHALARVSITVKNNGYTGDAKLSSIKFADAKTSLSGSLDATTGAISGTTRSDITLAVPSDNQTITSDGTTYECLLVPSGVETGKQTVTLTLTIDGEDKTATLSGDNGVIFAQGTKSNITITLSNSGISVQTISVEDWNVVEIGGHTVMVKVADDVTAGDIMSAPYVDGDKVIIHAYSYSGQHLKCTMPGGEFCTSQSKTTYKDPTDDTISRFEYTFTISDITENTSATIGYAAPVSISVTPDNSGSVKITGDAYEGETLTLTAIPAYEYGFDAWLDKDGDALTCEEETYSNARLSSDGMSVRFKENLILGGEFSVAAGKKVRFTRGNLYCSGARFNDNGKCTSVTNAQWRLEQRQSDYGGAWDGGTRISHFLWSKDCMRSLDKTYDGTGASGEDVFFTNSGSFTVSGISSSDYKCRTLTTEEWQYLFSYDATKYGGNNYDNDARRGKYKLGVTVCGKGNCIVLLPDNSELKSTDIEDSYDYVGWKHMEAAGAVCLPAAGFRGGDIGNTRVSNAGGDGFYWSASSGGGYGAFGLYFGSGSVGPYRSDNRSRAYSVRLVTECQSEPSAE